MLNIKLQTQVNGNYKDVMKQFDLKLFEALKPKGANMEIVEFTGSKKGDVVHIKFNSPIKAEWISHITGHGEDESECFFIDEGVKLPFPLTYWKHRHIVKKLKSDSSIIIDDIKFMGPNILITFILYPFIFLGFYPRKKIYRKYFANL